MRPDSERATAVCMTMRDDNDNRRRITNDQSNLTKAASNPLSSPWEMGPPSITMFSLPMSLHAKQDVDPFSLFAHPARVTDRKTD